MLSLFAILAGTMLPLQAALNARLAKLLGSPIWAAAFSGLLLTASLAVAALIAVRAAPKMTGAGALPAWAWAGGLCGAVMLCATTLLTPRLGSAATTSLVMVGLVLCSLALDQWGLFGVPTHPIDAKRAIGTVLLLGGALLVR